MRIPNLLNNCKARITGIVNYFNTALLKYVVVMLFFITFLLATYNNQYEAIREVGFILIKKENVEHNVIKKESDQISSNDDSETKKYIVASKNGKKYYYIWCAASNIKEENKVYFDTELEAENAGLSISTRC
jgi:hypothetical protein